MTAVATARLSESSSPPWKTGDFMTGAAISLDKAMPFTAHEKGQGALIGNGLIICAGMVRSADQHHLGILLPGLEGVPRSFHQRE